MRREKVIMWPLQPTYRRRYACWHQSPFDGDAVALGVALMIQGPVMILLTLRRDLQGAYVGIRLQLPAFYGICDRLRP